MSQWHTLNWQESDLQYAEAIVLHPHVDENGKKTVKTDSKMHPFHELDWSEDHESNKGKAHLHDGVIDHIKLHPAVRPQGISVHARWHDKDGNIVRQDAHMQCK